jgi:hypothetical protein
MQTCIKSSPKRAALRILLGASPAKSLSLPERLQKVSTKK